MVCPLRAAGPAPDGTTRVHFGTVANAANSQTSRLGMPLLPPNRMNVRESGSIAAAGENRNEGYGVSSPHRPSRLTSLAPESLGGAGVGGCRSLPISARVSESQAV